MNELLEVDDNILDVIVCMDESEKNDLLQFLASELIISQTKGVTKLSDFRFVRILSYLFVGKKIWDTKTVYSASDLDSLIDFYNRAPESVQVKLDPLMEIFKVEIFGSID